MSGLSRGAPDKVRIKVRGDGRPLGESNQEAEYQDAKAKEMEEARAQAGRTDNATLFERARQVLPGGVNSPVRAMRQVGLDPVFIESAESGEVIDRDGRHYLDWVGSWGPMILGHTNPQVLEAIGEAAARGTSFGAATEAEVELGEEVVSRMPSVEMIRMTSSGTEAAMTAARLARAATGREVLIKFAGAYHGHSDGLLAEAGSGVATHGVPSGPGIPAAQAAGTVVVAWNDRNAISEALASHDVAAVFAEPVAANMGVVPPDEGYLRFLREETERAGSLLVFDEVITGFRVARGGAQELFEVKPDLTVMGKIMGGGLPAAAVGGPRDLMNNLAPAGDVYQAGTLSGNPLAVAAGLATLRQLDDASYARLTSLTTRLVSGLEDLAQEHNLSVGSAPGLATLFFSALPVKDFEDAMATDRKRHAAFYRAMLERGIWLPPSQFEAWFVSLAHDEIAIDRTLMAAAEALAATDPTRVIG